ncbi:MAG: transglutaminase TgpA family protein [Burkholderiales bacterium]
MSTLFSPSVAVCGLRVDPLLGLIATLGLVLAPHLLRVPLWVGGLCVALGILRTLARQRNFPLPGKAWLLSLTVAAAAGIFLSYGTLLGRDAGSALLAVMLALKLLEMRNTRDRIVMVFLGYVLIIINFLYSQSILSALYMLFVVVLLTACLISIHHANAPIMPWRTLRLSATLVAQAMPLMIVLFILFPRVSGPLWGLPGDAHSAASGLSEKMTPGSISNLSLSDEIAFRVEFMGSEVPPPWRYWRGPVFWQFDGRTWSPGKATSQQDEPRFETYGKPVRYAVTLEPHDKSWLFALDLPAMQPPASRVSPDFQLLASKPIRSRIRYEIISFPRYRAGLKLSNAERARGLQLPSGGGARAHALAQRWRAESRDDHSLVQRALDMFRNEEFVYTLSPPILGADPVDEFLFDTRRGFCEHFSSSFAFLMRAAGIPARIVTGYQGGEFNPLGEYLMVRQADAHAWAEVWLEGRGWVRVDPTAAVAPQRVESGLAAVFPGMQRRSGLVNVDSDVLRNVRLGWDALSNGWNQWVLAYSPTRQTELFINLGFGEASWENLAGSLLAALATLLLILAALTLPGVKLPNHDPVSRAYQRFCLKMLRAGFSRFPHEGPLDFARRVTGVRPELEPKVNLITRLYIDLRYGTLQSAASVTHLRRLVQEFKPLSIYPRNPSISHGQQP